MTDPRRMLVWADARQEPLIRDAVRASGLALAGVGARRARDAAALGAALEVEHERDLRQAVQREDIDILWLAAPERIEPETRRLIRASGLRTVTSDPRPMAIDELVSAPADATVARFVPSMRSSAAYRSALDVIGAFGRPECVNIVMTSGPGEGLLLARLFDAMDLVDTLCGHAERLDAAFAGPLGTVPDAWAELHGHMTVNLRFGTSCCASVAVSDRAGTWGRRVSMLNASGAIEIDDRGVRQNGADGSVVDEQSTDPAPTAGALIGVQIARILTGHADTTTPPPDTARLLALCEAARLSARTGDGEAPDSLMRMLSRV